MDDFERTIVELGLRDGDVLNPVAKSRPSFLRHGDITPLRKHEDSGLQYCTQDRVLQNASLAH